ncbi:MAG: zinc transporter ZntB [Pseudomonadales bacterium]
MNTQESSAILFALELDGLGGARSLNISELTEPGAGPRWVHIDANQCESPETLADLSSALDITTAEAMLDRDVRPRCLQLDDNMHLSLRGVNLNTDENAEDMVAVRLWIEPGFLVSSRFRQLKSMLDTRDKLLSGKGPKTIADLVTQTCGHLLERMEPVLGDLDDDTDALEEEILENPGPELRRQITDVRKRAILFRRYIAPQREAIGQLRRADVTWLADRHIRDLQESHDRVTRYVEDLDAIRERAQIVKDELASSLSDQLNRNLYVLSVVTAIFLPLGFLTGLFGINVAGMPGVNNEAAFWIFVAFLIVVVAVQIVFFKRNRWF